jgi:hypothetical protein
MKTVKLNKKFKKNKKYNKTGKKQKIMQKGGSPTRKRYLREKSTEEPSIEERSIEHKRSKRGMPTEYIRVLTLGIGNPAVPTYSNQFLSDDVIDKFVVEKIEVGYQIVCLPMPPDESHSIVVHRTDNGVMISDWGGANNRSIKSNKWQNYTTFVRLLEEKYESVNYYEVDSEIDGIACKRHEANNGQGGCSQYVDKWIEKYIGKGEKTILYREIK